LAGGFMHVKEKWICEENLLKWVPLLWWFQICYNKAFHMYIIERERGGSTHNVCSHCAKKNFHFILESRVKALVISFFYSVCRPLAEIYYSPIACTSYLHSKYMEQLEKIRNQSPSQDKWNSFPYLVFDFYQYTNHADRNFNEYNNKGYIEQGI